jgi:hypothetical protein
MPTPTLFLCWRDSSREIAETDLGRLAPALKTVAGLTRALGFTPITASTDHPYAADGRGPAFTLELRFADDAALAAAAAAGGALARAIEMPSLATVEPDAQAFDARFFATADPEFNLGDGSRRFPCTFLVEYPVACADPQAWLDHYDAHHPAIMVRFPLVREVATYRPRPEFAIGFAVRRATAMQRNKVAFDDVGALLAALASPILAEMRADSANFPPVPVRPTHFPTATHRLV